MYLKNINLIMEYRSKPLLLVFFLLFVSVSYLLLVSPGQSYTIIWLNDTLALLDAAYRVSVGQIPNKDFVSAIGPINFYLSAVGLSLGLNPGVTFALGTIIALFIILLPGLVMMHMRFGLVPTLIAGVFFGLLITTPMATGSTFERISWGMFYNRQAWAALFFTLLFYVEPRSPNRQTAILDGTILSILVFFLLYCKITYGLVAVGFVFANMLISKYNRSVSFIAIVLIVLSIIVVEFSLNLNEGYIKDIAMAINQRGAVRADKWVWLTMLVQYADILGAAILSLIYAHIVGRRFIFDWCFVIGCCLVSIVLLDQNGGRLNSAMPSLLAVFIILSELVYRAKVKAEHFQALINGAIALQIILLIFITKPLLNRIIAIHDYHAKSSSTQPCVLEPPKLSSFCVKQTGGFLNHHLNNNMSTVSSVEAMRAYVKTDLSNYEYAQTINDGYQLIKAQNIFEPVIFVLDMADPFTFALQLPPRLNGYPFKWTWPSDNIEVVFKDVTLVMEPKMPYHYAKSVEFEKYYGQYLVEHYNKTASSKYWNLWQLKGK